MEQKEREISEQIEDLENKLKQSEKKLFKIIKPIEGTLEADIPKKVFNNLI